MMLFEVHHHHSSTLTKTVQIVQMFWARYIVCPTPQNPGLETVTVLMQCGFNTSLLVLIGI
jgi:hypothetical protein